MTEVVDVAWKFGVKASGSDGGGEGTALGQSFLQVRLSLAPPGSLGHVQQLHLEMNLRQFYKLLDQLERCNEAMNVVSSSSS